MPARSGPRRIEPRRRALQRIGLGALTLSAAGCGRNERVDGPLNFWAMGREAEVVNELLPDFDIDDGPGRPPPEAVSPWARSPGYRGGG